MPRQPREKPLHGVIISVAATLVSKHAEYNEIAWLLGAECHCCYHPSCTHYIFQVQTYMYM